MVPNRPKAQPYNTRLCPITSAALQKSAPSRWKPQLFVHCVCTLMPGGVWIAACAIYPSLHYSLTLRIGRLLSTLGGNLVTAHLLALTGCLGL